MGTIQDMSIHQVSVSYQADQDRLLMRLRTRDEQLFELWLTRRLMARLWQPLHNTASVLALGSVSPGATVLPEARDMMTQTLREQSSRSADFRSPFDETARERPLGDAPMLVVAIDIKRQVDQQVDITWRDADHRNLTMTLNADLLNNVMTLLEQALAKSEWGLVAQPAAAAAPAEPGAATTPRMLN